VPNIISVDNGQGGQLVIRARAMTVTGLTAGTTYALSSLSAGILSAPALG